MSLADDLEASLDASRSRALANGALKGALVLDEPEARALIQELRSAAGEVERLKDVLHRDRSGLAAALVNVRKAASVEIGPAEDMDEVREIAHAALQHIGQIAIDALRGSGDLAHAECCGRAGSKPLVLTSPGAARP